MDSDVYYDVVEEGSKEPSKAPSDKEKKKETSLGCSCFGKSDGSRKRPRAWSVSSETKIKKENKI